MSPLNNDYLSSTATNLGSRGYLVVLRFDCIWKCTNSNFSHSIFLVVVATRCQFHQHFTRTFLYGSALRRFSLVTFWLWWKDFGGKKHFRTKNACLKCWWNCHQSAKKTKLKLGKFGFNDNFYGDSVHYEIRHRSIKLYNCNWNYCNPVLSY